MRRRDRGQSELTGEEPAENGGKRLKGDFSGDIGAQIAKVGGAQRTRPRVNPKIARILKVNRTVTTRVNGPGKTPKVVPGTVSIIREDLVKWGGPAKTEFSEGRAKSKQGRTRVGPRSGVRNFIIGASLLAIGLILGWIARWRKPVVVTHQRH